MIFFAAIGTTDYNTHTHTYLTALFPGLPGWVSTRKVKPIWILLKQDTLSGSGISWAICESASHSRQITMPVPHHSSFLQARCPSFRPTNSVKAQQIIILVIIIICRTSSSWSPTITPDCAATLPGSTIDTKMPPLVWLVSISIPNGRDCSSAVIILVPPTRGLWTTSSELPSILHQSGNSTPVYFFMYADWQQCHKWQHWFKNQARFLHHSTLFAEVIKIWHMWNKITICIWEIQ